MIATVNIQTINYFKGYLMNRFRMSDLKDIKLFLGIKVERNGSTITLDQNAYIKTVLNKYKMYDCNAVSTSFQPN